MADQTEVEPREIPFFPRDGRWAGRYVRPYLGGEQYELETFLHVYPDGNYAYLLLPADKEQRIAFCRGILEQDER